MMMKKYGLLVCCLVLFLLSPLSVFADEATVVYVDGWVDIKKSSGTLVEAWEGDNVRTGESVITDAGSYAELKKESGGGVIKISPDTVFTIGEIERGGEKRSVLRTTLGSVAYKFGKAVGTEPMFATQSMVAGVRGTEFTVFAGADGSSLVAVESGQVDVTSNGETVELYSEEGVEVAPGEAPGEKFPVKRGQIDYSTWNGEKFDAFLENPVEALKKIEAEFQEYLNELETLTPEYNMVRDEVDLKRAAYREMKTDDVEQASLFYAEEVEPAVLLLGRLFRNIRYYSLSALSMKRFIVGRLYMEMKSRYIMDLGNQKFQDFLQVYTNIADQFEKAVVPHLVEADI